MPGTFQNDSSWFAPFREDVWDLVADSQFSAEQRPLAADKRNPLRDIRTMEDIVLSMIRGLLEA